MISVLVTFTYPDTFDEARVRQVADGAKAIFAGMPGLRSKAFTFDREIREARNFYIWNSEAAARAFFSPQLVERVTGLYGVRPSVQFLEIAALVDNGASA